MTITTRGRLARIYPVFLFGLCLAGMSLASRAHAADTVQMQVKLATITQGTLHPMQVFTGQIAPISSAVHVVTRAFEGQVIRLFVQPGSAIKKGMPLLSVRTSPSVRQQVARARASLDYARRHLAQIRQMLKSHLATQVDLAKAEQNLALVQADWQSLVASGATKPEHTIEAKHDGVVQKINVQLGGVFAANQPLLTTVDAGQMQAYVPVPVGIASQLSVGDAVKISPVFGGAAPTSVSITAIDSMVLPNTDRQPVRLRLPKQDTSGAREQWVMGQALNAEFTLPGKNGFILPHAALVTDGKGQKIIWVDKNHAAQRVVVHVLGTVDARSVVMPVKQGSLHSGDQVVVSGPENVTAGMKLTTASGKGN